MPGCQYGATTRPELVGLRTWLNADTLDLAIQTFLNLAFPSWRVSLAASLIDYVDLCELNPSPPEPFDVSLLLGQTQPSILGPAIPLPAVVDWVYRYVQYQTFLSSCVCNLPPLTPGNNCSGAPATISIGNTGSIAGPYPIVVDQAVLNGIITHPNGDWDWFRSGHATVDGGAHSGNALDIQIQATTGAWTTVDDIQTLNLFGTTCSTRSMSAATPKFGANTAVRIVNNAGGTHSIQNFTYCLCLLAPTPAPLPPFTEPPNVPPSPTPACSLDDVCKLVNELNRRLTVIAAQVSDIQAATGGRDQLQELARQTITGEGEATLVLGTRAVSVELTALGPEAFTSALGRPRGLMRVGSIRYGDGIGYSPRRFIDADRFDDVLPTGALTLSWQLLTGTSGILKMLG